MLHIVRHGHSFIEIVTDTGSVLVDPFITGNPKCDVTVEQIQEKNIIAICLTHGHGDHIGDTKDIIAGKEIPIICEYGVGKYFEKIEGYTHCLYGSIGGTVEVDASLRVKFFSATHGGGILESTMYCCPAGLLITCEGKKIYHAGDTSLMMDMQQLAKHHIDLACLPIDGVYNMNAEDAAQAAARIKPTTVMPIHYDTRPKIRVDAVDFARRVMASSATVPKVLTPGQYVVIE